MPTFNFQRVHPYCFSSFTLYFLCPPAQSTGGRSCSGPQDSYASAQLQPARPRFSERARFPERARAGGWAPREISPWALSPGSLCCPRCPTRSNAAAPECFRYSTICILLQGDRGKNACVHKGQPHPHIHKQSPDQEMGASPSPARLPGIPAAATASSQRISELEMNCDYVCTSAAPVGHCCGWPGRPHVLQDTLPSLRGLSR